MKNTQSTHAHMPTSPELPPDVFFGEATDDQLTKCEALAAAAFCQPLSEAEYVEREELMDKQKLAENDGVRTWCLYQGEEKEHVLAACKMVIRELLITDVQGSHRGPGYCIASVITHPDHRGHGLAPKLLQNVAKWLDRARNAPAACYTATKNK